MKTKNTIKNSLLALLFIFGLAIGSTAIAQRSISNKVVTILNDISTLADDFGLTDEQKSDMRSIVMGYLPSIALKTSAMIGNRQDLLATSLGKDTIDEDYLLEMAQKQGKLLASLIVIKEHLKKDIRAVLTDDQKDFVDELIQAIIQHRLAG
jgi:hypothetical protein